MKHCEYCGSKLILKSVNQGSHWRDDLYFNTRGEQIMNQHWVCEKAGFFNVSHTEYDVDVNVNPT